MIVEKLTIKGLKVALIHGFNVRDGGKNTIDKLAPLILDEFPQAIIDTDQMDYGWHGLLRVRFFHKNTVKRISKALKDCDLVITHSNGANYCMKALKLIDNINIHVCHISPALNVNINLGNYNFRKIDIFHSKGDWVVNLASYLPFHSWGAAGKYGIKSFDPRLDNHGLIDPKHSSWFNELSLEYFCKKYLFPTIRENLI